MAGIVSEALAGMAGMAEEQASHHLYDDLDKMQERHRGIIRDQVLPRMTKIQREMKGRRYKVRISNTASYCDEDSIAHIFSPAGGASQIGAKHRPFNPVYRRTVAAPNSSTTHPRMDDESSTSEEECLAQSRNGCRIQP